MALVELRLEEKRRACLCRSSCIARYCRQIAPDTFSQAGDKSAFIASSHAAARRTALKALVTCPTASKATSRIDPRKAAAAYPESIGEDIYFCGFASESSYGASSYLIVRPEGNVLVDSPRFAKPLANRIAELGGVKLMFLSHRDDVADHERWAGHFEAERLLHRDDITRSTANVERVLAGNDVVTLDRELLAIQTPGHRGGTAVLLNNRNKYLFSGDHLWGSPNYQSLHASSSVLLVFVGRADPLDERSSTMNSNGLLPYGRPPFS